MTLEDLLAIGQKMIADGRSREEVMAFLDARGEHDPLMAPAVAVLKGFFGPLFDQGNVSLQMITGVLSVAALIKDQYGKVSDAPEVGLG